ncbi:MAG TPA: hypothetical protein VGO47_05915 [Chlamydiales bacterium]|nr:hypothetical protein [Chlamydiales bacterium]
MSPISADVAWHTKVKKDGRTGQKGGCEEDYAQLRRSMAQQ